MAGPPLAKAEDGTILTVVNGEWVPAEYQIEGTMPSEVQSGPLQGLPFAAPAQAGLVSAAGSIDAGSRDLVGLLADMTASAADRVIEGGYERFTGFAEERRAEADDIRARLEPLRQEYPKATFTGSFIPELAEPSKKIGNVYQMASGAARGDDPMGILAEMGIDPESAMGRGISGALNVMMSTAGGMAGQAGERWVKGKARAAAEAYRGYVRRARVERLKERGVPLTKGQETGLPEDLQADRAANTAAGSQLKYQQQQDVLNEAAADALGLPPGKYNLLDKPVLKEAADQIGAVYQSVPKRVPNTILVPNEVELLVEAGDAMRKVGAGPKGKAAYELFTEFLGNADGATYLRTRQKMSDLVSDLWGQSLGTEAGAVMDLIGQMDEVIGAADPLLQAALRDAGSKWRFLKSLRWGRTLDPEGGINAQTLQNSLERAWPGWDIGRHKPPGAIGDLADFVDDMVAIAPKRPTSQSGENITSVFYRGTVKDAQESAQKLAREAYGSGAEQTGAAAARELAGDENP